MTHAQTKRVATEALRELDEPGQYASGYLHATANALYSARAIGLPDHELLVDIAWGAQKLKDRED